MKTIAVKPNGIKSVFEMDNGELIFSEIHFNEYESTDSHWERHERLLRLIEEANTVAGFGGAK